MTSALAIRGGTPVISRDENRVKWPIVSENDLASVTAALSRGDMTSLTKDGAVSQLEEAWAEYTNSKYCIAVSNGTIALSIALLGVGVQPGDEVIVPAFSFIASGLAPVHIGAIPVFADIDPLTYNIDISKIEALITERTAAIVPVHLHGLPVAMDELRAVANKAGVPIIEDAAQSHGAIYRQQVTGSMGKVGTFSLNVSKNLPTCGEGGLLVCNDAGLASELRRLRQFGEDLIPGQRREYLHHTAGWNAKMCGPQAAFALSQLTRFDEYSAIREKNVVALLRRLGALPGIIVPSHPEDCTHAWHILRFRVDAEAAGLDGLPSGRFRGALERALQAEGVPVQPYQRAPLPAQPVFQNKKKFHLHTVDENMANAGSSDRFAETYHVIETSFTLQKVHLGPDAGPLLDRIGDAFEKVFEQLKDIERIAASMKYQQPWAETMRLAS